MVAYSKLLVIGVPGNNHPHSARSLSSLTADLSWYNSQLLEGKVYTRGSISTYAPVAKTSSQMALIRPRFPTELDESLEEFVTRFFYGIGIPSTIVSALTFYLLARKNIFSTADVRVLMVLVQVGKVVLDVSIYFCCFVSREIPGIHVPLQLPFLHTLHSLHLPVYRCVFFSFSHFSNAKNSLFLFLPGLESQNVIGSYCNSRTKNSVFRWWFLHGFAVLARRAISLLYGIFELLNINKI